MFSEKQIKNLVNEGFKSGEIGVSVLKIVNVYNFESTATSNIITFPYSIPVAFYSVLIENEDGTIFEGLSSSIGITSLFYSEATGKQIQISMYENYLVFNEDLYTASGTYSIYLYQLGY